MKPQVASSRPGRRAIVRNRLSSGYALRYQRSSIVASGSLSSSRRALGSRPRSLAMVASSALARDHPPRDARAVAEGRLPARVLAGAAGHDDAEVLGAPHDRQHRARRVDGAVALDLLLLVLAPQPRERKARVLEEELLHLGLAVTVARDGGGVLGAQRQQRPAPAEQVVAAGLAHGAGHRAQHAEAGVAVVILDVVRALAAEHGDGADVAREARLDVQRLPRA